MSGGDSTLNNNAPDTSSVALIIIDMINDLGFPEGDAIFAPALAAAQRIAALKSKARQAGIPVIFANDNFGRWRSNFHDVVEHCLESGVKGAPLAANLAPSADDYFVLKPKHSAFYETPLELLLKHLDSRRLILCGISGNMCIQFTACDAYMRDFDLHIPCDCIASNTQDENERALSYMKHVLKADITASTAVDLGRLKHMD